MGPGGKERVVMHLATEFAARGLEPLVVCLMDRGEFGGQLQARGVPMVPLHSVRAYDWRGVLRLTSVLRQFRPDVINVHDRSSLPYVFLANRLGPRCPIVLSCHGLRLQDAPRPRMRDRLAMRGVQAVTAVSETAAAEYSEALAWRGHVEIIPNGVPVPLIVPEMRQAAREALGLPETTFALLAVGNVYPEKGYEDLLGAAALLHRQTAAPFVVLVVGSTANRVYWATLDAQARRLGLGDIVRFLGLRRDTPALYSAADAFVLSSRKEGMPMALLEAMASGLPVIATRVGGVPSVVTDRENGLLVPPRSPEALSDAMAEICSAPSLRRHLGARAKERVERDYSVERMASRYLSVYERAMSRAAGGPSRTAPRLSSSAIESFKTNVPSVADSGSARRCGPRAFNRDPKGSASNPYPTTPATCAGAWNITNTGLNKPRVLMLGPMPPPTGGMATVVDNLRDSRLADECRLIVLNNGKTTPEGRSLLVGIAAQLRLSGKMIRTILKHRAQIVHIHTCSGFTFWRDGLHLFAAHLLGSVGVVHVHGGRFYEFIASLGPVGRVLLRQALQTAGAVVVLSQDWLNRLRPCARSARWRIVPNGIVVPRDPNTDRKSPAPAFLFMGNLGEPKGVQDLVAAVALACQKGVRGDVAIAGGETAAGQRETVERQIEQSGCGTLVHLLGVVSGEAKEAVLSRSDCFVLPSYAEGLPMAMLEAMACGMPVIATRVGAIPEVVTDGVEGFLIEPGDVEALADRMVRASKDPNLCRKMGRAARRRVEQEYSLDAMVERLVSVYREVLASNRGRWLSP